MTHRRLDHDRDMAIAVWIVRIFMVVVFAIIAWTAVYLLTEFGQEVRAWTSEDVEAGTFWPRHCEDDRYSAECTGTFVPTGGGEPAEVRYRGDLDSLRPQEALRLPGEDRVYLVADGLVNSRTVFIGVLLLGALMHGIYWLVKRPRASARS